MGVRKVEDAGEFLKAQLVGGVLDLGHCHIAAGIRAMSDEAREEALEAIPRLMAYLRSGRARKNGDVGALARIIRLLRAIRERGQDLGRMSDQVQALVQALSPETLEEELMGAATSLASRAIEQTLSDGTCRTIEAGARAATAFLPLISVMETKRNAAELIRQVQLLWNSNKDLPSLLTFEAVAEDVLNALEDRLVVMVTAVADEGEARALTFVRQKLSPEEWIKAVQ